MPEERIYVIPLRKARRSKRYKRSARATKIVRQFIQRHLKSDEVKIGNDVNRKIWERGAERLVPKIRVRAVRKDDGSIEVSLAESAVEEKKEEKKEEEEKKEGEGRK